MKPRTKNIKDKKKDKFMKGLAESFNEVRLSLEGKKELKNATDVIQNLKNARNLINK